MAAKKILPFAPRILSKYYQNSKLGVDSQRLRQMETGLQNRSGNICIKKKGSNSRQVPDTKTGLSTNKPFSCSVCRWLCASKISLHSHMRTHCSRQTRDTTLLQNIQLAPSPNPPPHPTHTLDYKENSLRSHLRHYCNVKK